MIKKIFKLAAIATVAIAFTACNVTVPAGKVGKVMGPTGWQPELFPPSIVNIDNGPLTRTSRAESMYFMETTTEKYVQPIKVKLKDNMELSAAIIFTGRINSGDEAVVNNLFNDMKHDDRTVTTNEVYEKYGKQIVLQVARAVISQYKVEEINLNYDRINTQLKQKLAKQLNGLPISVTNITMGEIQYPKIVTDAIGKAQERKMQINEERAQVQIELTKIDGAEQVAKGKTRIKLLEGVRIRDYNKLIQDGITPQLLTLRRLELKEKELDVKLAEVQKWDGVRKLTTVMSTGNNKEIPIILDMKK